MLYYVMLYHIMLYYVILYHIIVYCVIGIMLYYNILCTQRCLFSGLQSFAPTANLRTIIMDLGGFDSSMILILRVGILMSIGDFPESLRQAILVGIMLLGKLGVYYTMVYYKLLYYTIVYYTTILYYTILD